MGSCERNKLQIRAHTLASAQTQIQRTDTYMHIYINTNILALADIHDRQQASTLKWLADWLASVRALVCMRVLTPMRVEYAHTCEQFISAM